MNVVDGYVLKDVTADELMAYRRKAKGSYGKYARLVLRRAVVSPDVTLNSFTGDIVTLKKIIEFVEEHAK